MLYGGSVQAMLTILRNNKLLLRKKNIFKKERTFLSIKQEYIRAIPGPYHFKHATKEELKRIREEVLKNRKKDALKEWTWTGIVVLFLVVLSVYIFISIGSYLFPTPTPEINSLTQVQIQKENQERFTFFVQSGDEWMQNLQYGNAVFQYQNALELYPNRSEIKLKLAEAMTYQCYYDGRDCEKAKAYIHTLQLTIEDSALLDELKELLKEK